jgi:peroxiredoxin
MKKYIPLVVAALALSFAGRGIAAGTQKGDAKTELRQLVDQVKVKLRAGKRTEKDLAGDLKQFDALLAEHKAEKTDDVAQILFMKAMLYVQVLDDPDQAATALKQLKTEFPNTAQAKQVDQVLAMVERQAASAKIRKGLAVGTRFPDFTEKDFNGKPVSVSKYKGKVVLIDFWATWCGPCVGEFPNVKKTYQKYHDKGFDIIGVSLDKDAGALTQFIKDRGVSWQQFFDGKWWQNKLAKKYGVESIPATYLLDRNGVILAKDVRGEALDTAVSNALAAKQ